MARSGTGTGYTTLDDLESRLDGTIERGEIDEHETWLEMQEAEAEYQLAQDMQEYFDMNGDPYMDFEGNPW